MYKLEDKVLELFNNNYRQIISIKFNGTEDTFELTEANILQGGLKVDRYCISGDKIEIGSAIASELSLTIDNRNEQFNNVTFEGAELFVRIGIKKWDADEWENAKIHWIPLGYFTVDETPRKLNSINIIALDRMVQFDKEVDYSKFTLPTTIGGILTMCCEHCNVPLATELSSLIFSPVLVSSLPITIDSTLTYRQLIQWIAEINGTCAYIDWDGKLRLEWYKDTGIQITPALRYTSDLYEDDITITGVSVTDDDGNAHIGGNKGYVFNIENNKLIGSNQHNTVAYVLGNRLKDFTYRPYSCTCKPAPYLYPLDIITFVDKKGNAHKTIITHVTYIINSSTDIAGKGETATKNSYASVNPLTKAESIILEKIKKDFTKDLTNRETALLQMNETISNSLGLYRTCIEENDGSSTYYYHDKELIEESTIIYTFKSGGFAWTDDWNNGDPVWQYGFTRDGNAVFKALSTYKITTEYLAVGSVTNDVLAKEVKDSITNEISVATTTLKQNFDVSIGQLNSEISLIKTDISSNATSISSLDSKITQTANQIELEVSAREQAISDVNSSISNVEASLSLYVTKDDNDQIVSMLNASADEINITSNRLAITSTYFTLTKAGKITATSGTIGGFTLTSSALYNGFSSFSTTGTNGVYLGTDGLNIGGNFKVSNDGTVSMTKGSISIGDTSGSYPSYTRVDNTGLSRIWGSRNVGFERSLEIDYNEIEFTSYSDSLHDRYLYIGMQGDVWGYGMPDIPLIRSYQYLEICASDSKDYGNSYMVSYIELQASDDTSQMTLWSMTGKLSGTWVNDSGSSITSDRDLKNSIESIDDKYSTLFDNLIPVRYKYNDGTSGRYHIGFIAQDVEQAILSANLSTDDFAGYLRITEIDKQKNKISYLALRYSEFIALCVNEIQKLKLRVNELEKEVQNG